jgi:hypothetical protein
VCLQALVDFGPLKFLKWQQVLRIIFRRFKMLLVIPFVIVGFILLSVAWLFDNEVVLSRFFKWSKRFIDKALQYTMVWGNKI